MKFEFSKGKLERQKSSDRSLTKTPSVETKKLENLPGKTIAKTPSTETKKLEKPPNKTLAKASSIENKKN